MPVNVCGREIKKQIELLRQATMQNDQQMKAAVSAAKVLTWLSSAQ